MKTKLTEQEYQEIESEALLVSKISPLYRRLDTLANMFQGANRGAALYFDGERIKLALNENTSSELAQKLDKYLRMLTSIDYSTPGYISRINEERTTLLRYVDAAAKQSYSLNKTFFIDNYLENFKSNLLRIEGSIHAYNIKQNPNLAVVFKDQDLYREAIAFPKNIIKAMKDGLGFIPGEFGVHAELKIAQELLYNNLDKIEAGKQFYIAISKKCCRNCEATIKAINDVFAESLKPTATPNYSAEALPGENLSLVTKEALVGLPGHQVVYPSPVPPFMRLGTSQLSEDLRALIVAKFLENIGRPNNSNLNDIFDEGHNQTHEQKQLGHRRSISPTSRISSILEQEEPHTKSYADRIKPPAATTISSSSVAETSIKTETPPKIKEIIESKEDADARLQLNILFNTKKVKKKSDTSANAKQSSSYQDEDPQEDTSWKTQPIIIFYERPDDPAATDTASSLASYYREINIGTLAMYEKDAAQNNNLQKHYSDLFKDYSRMLKEANIGIPADLSSSLSVYIANLNLIKKTAEQGIETRNIAMETRKYQEVAQIARKQLEKLNRQSQEFISSNSYTPWQAFNSERGMQLFKKSMSIYDNVQTGEHIAIQLAKICKTTGKGIVAVVEWNKAKIIEDKLASLGCNNITSFFIYKENAVDATEKPSMTFNMLKYNPDFANSVAMPNSIIIDAQDFSKETLKARVAECIRPVAIETIIEYQPEAKKWQEHSLKSSSPPVESMGML